MSKWPTRGTIHYGMLSRLLVEAASFSSPEMKYMAWQLVGEGLVRHQGNSFHITAKIGRAHV